MEQPDVHHSSSDIVAAGEVDDDGKPRRTGTVGMASAHIITVAIGSGILSLPWAVAQLGWVAGVAVLLAFAFITCFTCSLLADCYRYPDPVNGKRNYTYMQAVQAYLGGKQYWACAWAQYINLSGNVVGYTITTSISMVAIEKAICFHKKGHEVPCSFSKNRYIIGFGILEIFLSQIPNFHELEWLSGLAAVMSFAYALIGAGLSFAKIVSGNAKGGTLTGVEVAAADKTWRVFKALGNIAFAYQYNQVLIEIQDTLRSSPSENKAMKKANFMGMTATALLYSMCGFFGYAAFGNDAPGNMLTGFGFYEPFWLVDIGNLCIVVHLVGAYQVFAQPVFNLVETWASRRWPESKFITGEYPISIGGYLNFRINFLRLIWRTAFVVVATVLAMALPFFNDILAFLGAIGYWPLTIYFPIQMYIAQRKIRPGSFSWLRLQLLNLLCLLVALAAACGSIQGLSEGLRK